MVTKKRCVPKKTSTHYSREFVQRLTSTDDLQSSLSVGSTKRLRVYQKELAVSKGVERPLFDKDLKNLLLKYAWSPSVIKEALNYLNSLRDDDGYLFSRDLKIYSKTEESMKRFGEANHTSFRWNTNYQQSLERLIKKVSSCKLRPQRYYSDDDILRALPKTDTHSGYTWLVTGEKEKGKNVEGIYQKFKGRQDLMRSGEVVKGSPILIAFRTQASGEFNDDGSQTGSCKHKTRVVSMYDLLDVLDELQFANPFQKWINDQWFYAGGKDENFIARILSAYSVDYPKFMSIDYSSYDQTISDWLIEDAFRVIRSAFVLSSEEELVFNQVVQRFIHKDFILEEGIMHSDKGVPSGSMFTQIIDSIVNVLVVNTYFIAINQTCEMIAMGDDNAIFCDDNVDIKSLSSYIQKNFGLIIKIDDKSNEGNTRQSDVKFLSRYWTKGGAWRHPNQLISRMLFPERWRDYSGEVKPEHVLYAYILTYKAGMNDLVDIRRFLKDYPISRSFVMNNVDSRYIPGSLAYIREYTA